jgi:hypothetical protein
MGKSRFFTGQPIFAQLLSLVPAHIITSAVNKTSSNRYYKKFTSYTHLVSMLYACLQKCSSLREVTTGLMACQHKISHLGLTYVPKRSTLSDANRDRTEQFFALVYTALYDHYFRFSPDSRMDRSIESRLFLIDSTTISLFSEVMKGMGSKGANGKKKGGAKAHMLVKASEDVPRFVMITEGTTNDKQIMKHVSLPKHSIVVFDKGYNSYTQFEKWTKESVTWVTRISDVAAVEVIEDLEVSERQKQLNVISDQMVTLGRKSNRNTLKISARRITYYDAESKRTFRFITNNTTYSPATIAQIYKRRWQIELLFKRLKQNYPLRDFLGDNENAIKIQIWCSLITDLLLKIIKSRTTRKWSYANIAGMVRLHLMTYLKLTDFLNNPEKALLFYEEKNDFQLDLFKT